jgi:hypothetical protein
MTNHVHLLMTPGKVASISRVLQSVGRRYVQYVNASYQRSDTLGGLKGPRHFESIKSKDDWS